MILVRIKKWPLEERLGAVVGNVQKVELELIATLKMLGNKLLTFGENSPVKYLIWLHPRGKVEKIPALSTLVC